MDFVPHTRQDRQEMLEAIGIPDAESLLEAVPAPLRRPQLELPRPLSEMELTAMMAALAERNSPYGRVVGFLGAGAYHHYIPAAVSELTSRSEFYTAYTPYQPEISQGTLQSIFEFQSMVCALTGMDVANASVYDGATALAEAVLMAMAATRRNRVVVSGAIHPEHRAVLGTYLQHRGARLVTSTVERQGDRIVEEDLASMIDDETACCAVQQPDFLGRVRDLTGVSARVHELGGLLVASCDPISLGLLKSPGAWGADIAVGEGQGLGSPVSFGGPYLGILACKEKLVRHIPGRLVGATMDGQGRRGFILTLQAREQHIKREKATSNICTSEALVALTATVYLALMGPGGLKEVASLCFERAHHLASRVAAVPGFAVLDGGPFFNEFVLRSSLDVPEINRSLLERGIVGGYDLSRAYPGLRGCLLLCATETNTVGQIETLGAALEDMQDRKEGRR